MARIRRVSSDTNVKYVTFDFDEEFIASFQKFLSDIGIPNTKRKNLYKKHHIYVRGCNGAGEYNGTLHVISNPKKTITIEIFTHSPLVIVVFHHMGKDQLIGEALEKHFYLP